MLLTTSTLAALAGIVAALATSQQTNSTTTNTTIVGTLVILYTSTPLVVSTTTSTTAQDPLASTRTTISEPSRSTNHPTWNRPWTHTPAGTTLTVPTTSILFDDDNNANASISSRDPYSWYNVSAWILVFYDIISALGLAWMYVTGRWAGLWDAERTRRRDQGRLVVVRRVGSVRTMEVERRRRRRRRVAELEWEDEVVGARLRRLGMV